MRRFLLVLTACYASGAACQAARAETIRLEDGTEFNASVLERTHDSVILRVSRASVTSVDGRALPPPVTVGVKAPDFAAADLNGAVHHLDHDPKQPTLVQFWATWCPHCRSDLDLMQDLWRRYHEQGLRILSVSVDENLGALTSVVKERGLAYPIIAANHQTGQMAQNIPELYESRGIPAYFLVGRDGLIRRMFSGSIVEGNVDLAGEIEKALADASTRTARR